MAHCGGSNAVLPCAAADAQSQRAAERLHRFTDMATIALSIQYAERRGRCVYSRQLAAKISLMDAGGYAGDVGNVLPIG
ncbi:hypothetical protein AADEFJLK_02694 [Methylovulum psychrotolerans]|uniref:Uncharacterized protein n=1 Tax=Methylovulum psychrotolerans TaxID=1704499 RepID=A0A2S5CKC8_9GAMM|nr:hypothetical protein AADEFJLK_02694 [Methylovulum psychrotolerans]